MDAEDRGNKQGEGQIGPLLERKRLEKGLSLKEVEQATKIRTRYLEGLEREDPTVLPDPVYARGFLKTYANFLGLDGEQLSQEMRDRRAPRRERQLEYERPKTSEFEQPLITPGGLGGTGRGRISGTTILTVALAVLVLATVIGVLYYIGSRSVGGGANDTPEELADQSLSQEEEEEPDTETAARRTDPAAANSMGSNALANNTVTVTVKVVGFPSGLTVLTDGTVASDLFAQPGFSQTFKAQRAVTVSAANAGAVEVEANGQNIGRLGQYGQGATREFTPQSRG